MRAGNLTSEHDVNASVQSLHESFPEGILVLHVPSNVAAQYRVEDRPGCGVCVPG